MPCQYIRSSGQNYPPPRTMRSAAWSRPHLLHAVERAPVCRHLGAQLVGYRQVLPPPVLAVRLAQILVHVVALGPPARRQWALSLLLPAPSAVLPHLPARVLRDRLALTQQPVFLGGVPQISGDVTLEPPGTPTRTPQMVGALIVHQLGGADLFLSRRPAIVCSSHPAVSGEHASAGHSLNNRARVRT